MQFEVKSSGVRHVAIIDGNDISSKVKSVNIDIQPLELTEVTLNIAVTEEQITIENANIFVKINDKIYRIMEVVE